MKEIRLKTPTLSAKICVGTDVIQARLPYLLAGQKNFVLTDSNVYALYADFFREHFNGIDIFVLEAGEQNKNFQSLYRILEKMAGAGLHRNSRLFAVGGGVIGDIGGLAAALYMRGISCVQIPTTLLAQVDSSVGGKTAVDLGGVKNVVGAFYQPCEVLVDPTFLQTLPKREIKCGLGEIVKYAALNYEVFTELETQNARFNDLQFLQGLIETCIEHKARVVEMDEKETGERKSLNVGHTTGHAIELSSYLSHGESVLYGTWLETHIAMQRGVCAHAYGERLLGIVKKAICIDPSSPYDFSCLAVDAQKAKSDKKNVNDGKINLSVAKGENQWTSLCLPFDEYVAALTVAAKAFEETQI